MDWIFTWWPATVLGPIILGGAIAYALMTRRRLTPREKQAQHEAVDHLYGKDRPDPEKRPYVQERAVRDPAQEGAPRH